MNDTDTINETLSISYTITSTDTNYAGVTMIDDEFTVIPNVTIGSQTWTATNLALTPTAHNTLNTDYWNDYGSVAGGNEFDEDGYYYTWNAAMNVYPSGWKLPSDADWKVLEGHLDMTTAEQNETSWRGTTEGTKLKVNDMSKFNAKLTGFLNAGSGTASFIARGEQTSFWTNSEHIIGGFAYDRTLRSDKETVSRNNLNNKTKGLSVHCLRRQ